VVRKLPFPDNPEAGFGAIAEDGSTYFVDRAAEMLPSDIIDKIVNEQKCEVTRRVDVLRKGEPLPTIKNRIVILVDDGIAMGSTMRAALLLCRARQAKEIIVASPVAGPAVAAEFEKLADRVVILEKPVVFRAVAQAYKNWHDVTDREVLDLLQTRQKRLINSQSVTG
jgi:putative phosphoribosyl transferase